jgi:hypothetical protein
VIKVKCAVIKFAGNKESGAMRRKTELISLVPRRFGLFTSQINPRGPRKGRASLEQHIAPGYEAVN